MSHRKLLTHRCTMYHLREKQDPPVYGVEQPITYAYGEMPDAIDVPSYWYRQTLNVQQTGIDQPGNNFVELFTVQFGPEADVRANDKVIWNGIKFKFHIPELIKNHHWEVTAERDDKL